MKKTGVILVAIISLILASCDVDWDKLYPESQNPDLDENYFVITKTLPETLKLTGNLDENQMVALFDFEKMQFLKDDYVAFEMEISNEKEFYNYSKVGTIINENHVFAKASDLLDIFQRMFYIEDSRVMYIRYIAYKINSNDSKTRIGAYEQYFGETTVTFTLTTEEDNNEIAQADFIYFVGAPEGWAGPSEDNASHYEDWKLYDMADDGNYTGTFYIPEGEFHFRFYKALTGWDGGDSFGSQADDAPVAISFTDGIYEGEAVDGKGCWYDPTWAGGIVRITVNINDGTVLFEMK